MIQKVINPESRHFMPTSIPIILQKKRSLQSAMQGVWHWLEVKLLGQKFKEFHVKALSLKYKVPSGTIFSWNLSKYGAYESANTNLLSHWFRAGQGGLFVDVGANFGWYSMQMSRFAGSQGRVISIEPEENNQKLLAHNIALNDASNVVVIGKGVAEKEMVLQLYQAHDSNPGMHSFVHHEYMTGRTAAKAIEITTLDQILAAYDGSIELIKMDIEGYEVNALLGAHNTLRRCKRILIEYSPMYIKASGQDYRKFFDLLDEAGFDIYELKANQLIPVDSNRMAQIKQLSEEKGFFLQDFMGIQRNLGSL